MTDIDKLFTENPLLHFSIYTHSQATYLVKLGNEILAMLDSYDQDIEEFDQTYHLFWLWILGTYEVLRTLDQHSNAFRESFSDRLKELKLKIAHIRIPFAKQERRGNAKPVEADLSVVGVSKDLHYMIDSKSVSARDVISTYCKFIQSISAEDLRQEDVT